MPAGKAGSNVGAFTIGVRMRFSPAHVRASASKRSLPRSRGLLALGDNRDKIPEMMEKVREAVKRHRLLEPGDKIVVAVSGGADSMALLHALHQLSREWNLSLVVAHLNHGIRPDAALDLEVVREAAQKLGLPLVHTWVDVPALARAKKKSLEEAGRQARRAFLENTAREVGAAKIALGHTRTDLAETILLNLVRGAGVQGLKGFAPIAPPYIRPLVLCSRAETRIFCQERGIPYRDDPTNEDRRIPRNRLRLAVLPELEKINPKAEEALARAAELLAELEEIIAWAAGQARGQVEKAAGLDVARLRTLPPAVQAWLLKGEAERVGLRLEKRHLDKLLTVLPGDGPKEIVLPRKFRAWLYRGTLRIVPPPGPRPALVPLPGEGTVDLPEFGLRLHLTRSLRPKDPYTSDPWKAHVDAAKLELPLAIRAAKTGEKLRPLGLQGTKKVADLLAEAGIPPWERRSWPLLCDARGVVWVVGVRISEDHKVTPSTTEVLRVEAERR